MAYKIPGRPSLVAESSPGRAVKQRAYGAGGFQNLSEASNLILDFRRRRFSDKRGGVGVKARNVMSIWSDDAVSIGVGYARA